MTFVISDIKPKLGRLGIKANDWTRTALAAVQMNAPQVPTKWINRKFGVALEEDQISATSPSFGYISYIPEQSP